MMKVIGEASAEPRSLSMHVSIPKTSVALEELRALMMLRTCISLIYEMAKDCVVDSAWFSIVKSDVKLLKFHQQNP